METNNNYAGIPDEFAQLDTAKVVLIPVPYDGTSTWGKGADKGPDAFLDASANMELYDIETGTEVYQQGVYLADAVTENSSPEAMVDAVHQSALNYLNQGKFVTLFGGEHSISIGSIRAYADKYDDLTVLQIDAHTDLRPEYMGSACNHACAVYESSQKHNLIQVGIRSMDESELEHMNADKVYFAHQIMDNDDWMNRAISQMGENVFITIDLDAFDPSILPHTGTPEPGGMGWYQTLKFLKKVIDTKTMVGFDIVELCPSGQSKPSDFLAAKLYYKLLSYKFLQND